VNEHTTTLTSEEVAAEQRYLANVFDLVEKRGGRPTTIEVILARALATIEQAWSEDTPTPRPVEGQREREQVAAMLFPFGLDLITCPSDHEARKRSRELADRIHVLYTDALAVARLDANAWELEAVEGRAVLKHHADRARREIGRRDKALEEILEAVGGNPGALRGAAQEAWRMYGEPVAWIARDALTTPPTPESDHE
jgi:hypothetical protein